MPAPPASRVGVTVDRVERADLATYTRLASCPQCAGRRRVLVEVGQELHGRCLECGADLSVPLATEQQSRVMLVGRAGQGIVTVESDD